MQPIQGITETTRDQIVLTIEDWMRSGEHLDVLKERLADIPALDRARAERIAVTEVTNIHTQGKLDTWRAAGVTAKRWITQRDERVCNLCGPLHGQIVSIEAQFPITAETIAERLKQDSPDLSDEDALARGESLMRSVLNDGKAPPLHVNCRCDLGPV